MQLMPVPVSERPKA